MRKPKPKPSLFKTVSDRNLELASWALCAAIGCALAVAFTFLFGWWA